MNIRLNRLQAAEIKSIRKGKALSYLKALRYSKTPRSLKLLKSLIEALNWLVPNKCINCHSKLAVDSLPCCDECYSKLPFQNDCCQRCGQAFAANNDYCGRCLTKAPPFDACFCAFRYESPIKDQIQQFKYSERPELAKSIAKLLASEISTNQIELPDLLIPVPMHISRLRQRGYNQSWLLTQQLGRLLDIPYSNSILEKHKATPAQAKLSLAARRKNNRGCFRMKSATNACSVAIIDDVFTTGSTAAEIAKVLKRNGVNYVQIWGVAHTN